MYKQFAKYQCDVCGMVLEDYLYFLKRHNFNAKEVYCKKSRNEETLQKDEKASTS